MALAAWIKMSLGMKLGLGQDDFVLDGDHATPSPKVGGAPKFSAHVYCGQMAGWMKLVLGMEVGLSPEDFVLDGDPAPFPKRWAEHPQIFGPCLLRPNGWMKEAGTWHGGRPQLRRLCVRWEPSPLPQKKAEPSPQFSAHFYSVQTAGCIKMPLGMEVGFSPGEFVLDGDPAPSPKGGEPLPNFKG